MTLTLFRIICSSCTLFSSSTLLTTLPPTFSEMAPLRSLIVRFLTDLAVPRQVFEFSAYSYSSKYFPFLLSQKTGSECFNLNEAFLAYLTSLKSLFTVSASLFFMNCSTSSALMNGPFCCFRNLRSLSFY